MFVHLLNESTQDMRGTIMSTHQKRRATDVRRLPIIISLLAMIICHSLYFDNLWQSIPNAEGSQSPVAVSGSWMNVTIREWNSELASSTILRTLSALTEAGSLTKAFAVKALIGLSCLIPIRLFTRILKRFVLTIIKAPTSWKTDYNHHFIIVCAGKLTLTSILLAIIYFWWDEPKVIYNNYSVCAVLIESGLLFYYIYQHVLLCISGRTVQTFSSTFRYYLDHRYLILFQLLNYLTILFTMAYLAVQLYEVYPRFIPQAPMGMLFILYLLHGYGEMVIIMSKASCEHGMVPLRTVLSSMVTVSRCHIGTIMMNIPSLGFFFRLKGSMSSEENSEIINGFDEYIYGTNTMKNLIMFTAVHGQDLSEASQSIRYFKRKNQLVTNYRNKLSSVWTDILAILLPAMSTMIFGGLFGLAAGDFVTTIFVFTLYAAVIGSCYYVFVYTMNTVENTIEFCNMIKREDITLMHEEKLHRGPAAGRIDNQKDR